ncbi:MAG: 5-formyltetrahydrofolate cyclo-ligase [Dactylosporangium sp.]|nr:5-formyltetrahydrofolate cyclo-ligase [Dactylosporangium sp.]NNJ62261.1 5-formyltetrahydrofolate cyclo-ligase [Dactylosporangium sp.]
MSHTEVDHAKQVARRRVWTLLECERASPPGVYGNIPWFTGADQAAARLAALDIWRQAQVIKSNPDHAQYPVRLQALRDGKLLYMAVPRIATTRPFYRLDPTTLTVPFEDATTARGASQVAPTVSPEDMRPVDLVIAGSVAVNRNGARLGKGAGYSDLEVALLIEAGLIRPNTVIATTVHDLQIVDDSLPETDHDFSVDLIVTPSQSIRCPDPRRPVGIIPDHLTARMARTIPILHRWSPQR